LGILFAAHSVLAADPSVPQVVEKFNQVMDAEKRSPTQQSDLQADFAHYPVLSFDAKFGAHVRCIALSGIGKKEGYIGADEAGLVQRAHAGGMVDAAKTPEEVKTMDDTIQLEIFKTMTVYTAAGMEASFQRDFPACQKFKDSIPST
jgi:hypothetical protein